MDSTEASAATPPVRVVLTPGNMWRICLVVLAAVALGFLVRFVLVDAGSLIFTLVMSWFTSLAMEPAVRRLSNRMKRSSATLVVMILSIVALVVFLALFGQLFLEQVARLLQALPGVITSATEWCNAHFGTSYQPEDILASINLTPAEAANYAGEVLGGVLGVVGTVLGAVFGMFTFGFFTFYFSADGPRLRRWLARLVTLRYRPLFENVWELSLIKTGGFVAARVTLAAINSTASSICFVIIGMPSWLALGIWTGVVAQFIPTIGTYISIALPVIVGLTSPEPWIGVAALAFGIVYQQIENLTIEPRISARAVDIHPGVSFASVILGGALFGAAGALLAIPVIAMLLSILESYIDRRQQPGVDPPSEALDMVGRDPAVAGDIA